MLVTGIGLESVHALLRIPEAKLSPLRSGSEGETRALREKFIAQDLRARAVGPRRLKLRCGQDDQRREPRDQDADKDEHPVEHGPLH